MITRRFLIVIALLTTATSFFLLGVISTQRHGALERATLDARLDALRAEMRTQVEEATGSDLFTAGTSGVASSSPQESIPPRRRDLTPRDRMIAEIKQELQDEMGLLPLQLLRDRRSSFVELYATDNFGKTSYGTAGYLGDGYFITVKHAVVALKDDSDRQAARRIESIRISYQGSEIPAKLVDAGDADAEVHNGDWAIIRSRELDLPRLRLDTAFAYGFADPIFRMGNDYSKGIILSTGYIGQRTTNGLVTCLTDGHPGVSGGGVLNQRGDLVGIPIGRMQGDYRFSFILPLREEMFRKVPLTDRAEGQLASAAE
jgi:hypothetical protein